MSHLRYSNMLSHYNSIILIFQGPRKKLWDILRRCRQTAALPHSSRILARNRLLSKKSYFAISLLTYSERLTHFSDGLDNLVSDDSRKWIDQNQRYTVLSTHFRGKQANQIRHRHQGLSRRRRSMDACILPRHDLWLWTTLQLSLERAFLHPKMPHQHPYGRDDDFRSDHRCLRLAFTHADSIDPLQSLILSP